MNIGELIEEGIPRHLRTRNKPFSEEELASIHKWIAAFEEKGKDSISSKALGFRGEMNYADFMQHIGFSSRNSGYKKQLLSLNQIYAQDQDGVSISNLKTVLDHWDTAPLPQVVLMDNGYYWLEEGHHRLALQRLANRKQMEVFVDYKKKRKINANN